MSERPGRRTIVAMDTFVTIDVVVHREDPDHLQALNEAVDRAFGWFDEVEQRCSRFDPASELMQLTAHAKVAVPVSEILFNAVQFAVAVAEESGGAFDPTVGHLMEARGFNRDHRTGRIVRTALDAEGRASYRDLHLDPEARTITLLRPLVLDLGAVAKGFAIDLAARELLPFQDFLIDAGGDLYLGGRNRSGAPWCVGIRHPRRDGTLIGRLRVSNRAVCTSGDYERRADANGPDGHHIIDPGTAREGADGTAASVTVVAATAMFADALGTAAFVLGPARGLALIERLGADGLIVSTAMERHTTRGMRIEYERGETIDQAADCTSEVPQIAKRAAHHRAGGAARPGRSRERR